MTLGDAEAAKMDWVSENWFWLLLLIGWVVFMLRVDEEVDQTLRPSQQPSEIDGARDYEKARSARYLDPVGARARLSSLYRRRPTVLRGRKAKPRSTGKQSG